MALYKCAYYYYNSQAQLEMDFSKTKSASNTLATHVLSLIFDCYKSTNYTDSITKTLQGNFTNPRHMILRFISIAVSRKARVDCVKG